MLEVMAIQQPQVEAPQAITITQIPQFLQLQQVNKLL